MEKPKSVAQEFIESSKQNQEPPKKEGPPPPKVWTEAQVKSRWTQFIDDNKVSFKPETLPNGEQGPTPTLFRDIPFVDKLQCLAKLDDKYIGKREVTNKDDDEKEVKLTVPYLPSWVAEKALQFLTGFTVKYQMGKENNATEVVVSVSITWSEFDYLETGYPRPGLDHMDMEAKSWKKTGNLGNDISAAKSLCIAKLARRLGIGDKNFLVGEKEEEKEQLGDDDLKRIFDKKKKR